MPSPRLRSAGFAKTSKRLPGQRSPRSPAPGPVGLRTSPQPWAQGRLLESLWGLAAGFHKRRGVVTSLLFSLGGSKLFAGEGKGE